MIGDVQFDDEDWLFDVARDLDAIIRNMRLIDRFGGGDKMKEITALLEQALQELDPTYPTWR
jgi:hypothetical protein